MGLITEPLKIRGGLVAYDRYNDGHEVGSWKRCYEADNIVLNQYYNDLFTNMAYAALAAPPVTAPVIQMQALALGYGVSPTFARTQTALAVEWNNPLTTLTTGITSGTAGITSIAVAAIPAAIASGASIQLGTGQTLTTTALAAIGATSISVSSFTASQTYAIGTGVNVLSWTPQRMSTTVAVATTSDPPSMAWSYYLPAAANTISLTFTEAGLLYGGASLSPGGAGPFATHVAFAYAKAANTDLRIDYVLQRTST